MGFFSRLVGGLKKTRETFVRGLSDVVEQHDVINEDFYDDLEEIMIKGDIGIRTTEEILDELRDEVKAKRIKKPSDCTEILVNSLRSRMRQSPDDFAFENKKSVVMVIGVNGAGKTTSVGKLACIFKNDGKKVIMAAADTYRAAANEQLTEWAHRAGVPIISGQEGADPGSVVYDAIASAKAHDTDILLVDTAGRLNNKKNLMNELAKLRKIIDKEYPEAYVETLLVLDGATGQNAVQQARDFGESAGVTGIILTKLDGTARGGVAIAIQAELGIPVKYIGVGEQIEDMHRFDSDDFINALFDKPENKKN